MKTRDTTSPGYQQVLAAHLAVAPDRRVDPGIAEAVERQTRAMRELSRRAFPELETYSDDQPTPIEAARIQRRRESEATRARALRRAWEEHAARQEQAAAARTRPGTPVGASVSGPAAQTA
ncbi:hypothetical protein ACIPSA_49320 [Streptomyces sp. NPDC086549]|uniref:hypothetical protein n=1 Tax=Streptomyces sp. NPDC086549 TaxID=3365752 RepID=UPI0037F254E5